MNKILNKIGLLIVGLVFVAFIATPVYAQTAATAGATAPATPPTAINASSSISTIISRADAEIDQRTNDLNDIITRIGEVQKLSTTNQALLIASAQNEINQLSSLKSQIDAETNTAAARIDYKSITKSYGIYDLIATQTRIVIAADKVISIVSSMNLVAGKIQSRIANISSINSVTVQQQYSDAISKITDASTQGIAATNEVIKLLPDKGVATILQSNTAALKDARAKLKTATDDLSAARDDFANIASFLMENASTATPSAQ